MLMIEPLKLRCGFMQGDFFLFDLLLFGGVTDLSILLNIT